MTRWALRLEGCYLPPPYCNISSVYTQTLSPLPSTRDSEMTSPIGSYPLYDYYNYCLPIRRIPANHTNVNYNVTDNNKTSFLFRAMFVASDSGAQYILLCVCLSTGRQPCPSKNHHLTAGCPGDDDQPHHMNGTIIIYLYNI